MVTAFISHPSFYEHEVPEGHPECSRRLSAINDQLYNKGIYDLLQHHEATRATREQLERVHTARLLNALQDISPSSGFVTIDADTFMGPHTLDAAWHAAGAAVMATDLVIGESCDNAFCAVRPPGHHAERDRAMGFCFFNNVAVAAAHALDKHGLEHVAILDFDVHLTPNSPSIDFYLGAGVANMGFGSLHYIDPDGDPLDLGTGNELTWTLKASLDIAFGDSKWGGTGGIRFIDADLEVWNEDDIPGLTATFGFDTITATIGVAYNF